MAPRSQILLFFSSVVLILTIARYTARFHSTFLKITFFDVGQGDSILVEFPGGKTLLVDAGGAFQQWSFGRRELYLELARKGILKLDALVLSHPDRDHAGGFPGLMQQISVGELWLSDAFRDQKIVRGTPLLKEILELAQARAIPVRAVKRREFFRVAGVPVEFIAPQINGGKANDRSLLVFLSYGGCSILLTGDIEARGEKWLEQIFLPPVTLLKVPHHGSRTSSSLSFLRRLRPKFSVISAGYKNAYGHPHAPVLARLGENGSEIFRTDFHGYLEFRLSRTGEVRCDSALGACGVASCSP